MASARSKTNIYFALGFVWLAASSILRYVADVSAGLTRRTFKKKHYRLALLFLPSCPLMDRHIRGPGSLGGGGQIGLQHNFRGQTNNHYSPK